MQQVRRSRLLPQILLLILVIVILVPFARWGTLHFYRAAFPIHYSSLVEEQSARRGLSPSLVYAVIRTESGFDPRASSSVQARGLMQITEETFAWAQMREREDKEYSFEALYDTGINIHYGTLILELYMEEFDNEATALAAYHAGRSNAKRWLVDPGLSQDGHHIDTIPFRDTAYYVDRVLETREMYRRLYGID